MTTLNANSIHKAKAVVKSFKALGQAKRVKFLKDSGLWVLTVKAKPSSKRVRAKAKAR